MKKFSQSVCIFSIICFLGLLLSCEKLDTTFKKYVEEKEIVYPGTPGDITAYPGDKRVQFNWNPSSDPSVRKYVVYWNNNGDSTEFVIPEGKRKDFKSVIVENINEGTHFFTIYTYDGQNNKSVPTYVSNIRVFGDYYRAGLTNRPLLGTDITEKGEIIATFGSADDTNVITEIFYTTTNNVKEVLELDPSKESIIISDWKEGTPVTYKSSYKPALNVIDTFSTTQASIMGIKKDVSARYLVNYQQPFASVQNDGRFRDPANWVVNGTVKNHNNLGGWGTDENTVLVMESGWGAPNIENGKIYQTANLPAGTYGLELELGGFGIGNSQVKLVAVPGAMMPDFSTDGQVFGSYGTVNLELKELTFDVPKEGPVSIGFLAKMVGDQYWRVKSIKLYRYY